MKVICKRVLVYAVVIGITLGCHGVAKPQQKKVEEHIDLAFDVSKQHKRYEIYGAIVERNRKIYGTK